MLNFRLGISNIVKLHIIKENINFQNKYRFEIVNCFTMTNLSSETQRILKRLSNTSSEDPKNEIRENVKRFRQYGQRVPSHEMKNFIKAIAINFHCAIRDAIKSQDKMNTADEICEFIIEKFLFKEHYEKIIEELEKLRKKNLNIIPISVLE